MKPLDKALQETHIELKHHLKARPGGHLCWTGPEDLLQDVKRLVVFYKRGTIPTLWKHYLSTCGDPLCVAPEHHQVGALVRKSAKRVDAKVASDGKRYDLIPNYRTGKILYQIRRQS